MHEILPIEFDLFRLYELNPERYPFLLESVAHGTLQSRYDILFAFPQETLRLHADATLEGPDDCLRDNFISSFNRWFLQEQSSSDEDTILPYRGGWFIYLAYELASEIETSLVLPQTKDKQSIAYAARCPAAIIRDHEKKITYLFAEKGHEDLIQGLQKDVNEISDTVAESDDFQISLSQIIEEEPRKYCRAVERIKKYIIEGDVFQVNLSRLWKAKLDEQITSADVYKKLRINNPAPFACFARLPDMTIISSSPERLVSIKDRVVETRPIAGTRPRSDDLAEDMRLADELLAHPKEQAEHIMLIDLERNDLGRVCQPGTIQVDELMVLESFTHVHHIVSNVRGVLRDNVTPIDVIKAVFPGGTITGCPKVRCMEIVAELEQQPRGAYTGSVGYINRDGSMDTNILIRTLIKSNDEISFRAGAGIVYDSDPQRELDETRAKALGLLRALSVEN